MTNGSPLGRLLLDCSRVLTKRLVELTPPAGRTAKSADSSSAAPAVAVRPTRLKYADLYNTDTLCHCTTSDVIRTVRFPDGTKTKRERSGRNAEHGNNEIRAAGRIRRKTLERIKLGPSYV